MKEKIPNFNQKIALISFSIALTILAIYFSIPKFIQNDLYSNLSEKLDEWNINESNPNGNQSSNQKPNHNNNNQNNNNSDNNQNSNQDNNNPDSNINSENNNNGNQNNNNSNPNNPDDNNSNQNIPNNPDDDTPDIPNVEKPIENENGEKTFQVTFFQNGADTIGATSLSCTTKEDSCFIKLPSITRNNGSAIGWSQNKNAFSGYAINSNYEVTHNQYLYAITYQEKTISFDLNGATSLSFYKTSCKAFNNNISCSVSLPTIQRNNGYGIGFSTNENATKSDYGNTLDITNDLYLYTISATKKSANFYPNGALQIGSNYLECTAYNQNNTCTVYAPTINQDSYTTIGWNTSSESSNVLYSIGNPISLTNNSSFYAIRRISESGFLTSNAYASLELINNLRKSKGLKELKWSKSLEFSAQLRVKEVISHPNKHIRPDGSDFYTANDLAYGENWTEALTNDPNEMHNMFVNSTPHLNNLLSADYTIGGVAALYNQSDHFYYWVELFG